MNKIYFKLLRIFLKKVLEQTTSASKDCRFSIIDCLCVLRMDTFYFSHSKFKEHP